MDETRPEGRVGGGGGGDKGPREVERLTAGRARRMESGRWAERTAGGQRRATEATADGPLSGDRRALRVSVDVFWNGRRRDIEGWLWRREGGRGRGERKLRARAGWSSGEKRAGARARGRLPSASPWCARRGASLFPQAVRRLSCVMHQRGRMSAVHIFNSVRSKGEALI